VGEDYGFAGNYSADSISGASPLHHNTLSGASGMVTDYRQAGDVRLARYFSRASVGLRAGVSTENDYFSRAAGVDGTFSTADNNTTYAWGIGGAADRINSVNGIAVGQTRHTTEYLAGITQALTPASLVQVNLTYARGHGYYSDPYKLLDHRPDTREQTALLVRYRYYVDAFDAVLRTDYRFYRDTWDLRAHTIDVAWDQNLPHGWSVTPSLRYYWQNAASFYHDPPYPSGFTLHGLYSADTRLSAFGALAPAIKVAKEFGAGWSADARLEFYRQRSGWYPAGDGSPGLETFSARSIIAGVKKTF
jgi:hypothetical protein